MARNSSWAFPELTTFVSSGQSPESKWLGAFSARSSRTWFWWFLSLLWEVVPFGERSIPLSTMFGLELDSVVRSN
ncbi:hypothetical protein SLA2020_452460 [Shorea laevis]